jgi:thioredoxin reductase (NADPH)
MLSSRGRLFFPSSKRNKQLFFSTNTILNNTDNYDYDVFVIGGGSGGLACAKEAASLEGNRVGLCDFVKPSTQNSTWGLGGTCVNVGCIPKKLMHHSALIKDEMNGATPFGWSVPSDLSFNWETLVNSVQNHIKSLNFGYKNDLMSNDVSYVNQLATFVDSETVLLKNKRGVEKTIRAKNYVLAVGGRPTLPHLPGIEHVITSDDIFSLKVKPGKILIVGASYIALECAGFLHKFGFTTSVMVRSIVLRGFDIQVAGLIHNHMREEGINFIGPTQPSSIEKLPDGKLRVVYIELDKTVKSEIYDTVLYATGRHADTKLLNLEKAGVSLTDSGKVIVNEKDQTSNPNVYAIGDCVKGCPELTPVAIRAGKLLAKRLTNQSTTLMNYKLVPTTVFTPIEYGTIGYSEEEASLIYGEKNIEIYHSYFQPLEKAFDQSWTSKCYVKIICNKMENEKIIGFHLFSPNAGEITQGFATAMQCGATKAHFDNTIGIHPTIAEELTLLKVTKRENENPMKAGC